MEWSTWANEEKAMEGNIMRYRRDINKSNLPKPLTFLLYIFLTKVRIRHSLFALTFLIAFGLPLAVYAHPHMFFEAQVSYMFDSEGLARIRVQWTLDEYSSLLLMDEYDVDKNGVLSDDELLKLRDAEGSRIQEDKFYSHLKVDGKSVVLPAVTDFTVRAPANGSLTYSFTIPLAVKATSKVIEVSLAQYDQSYFSDFILSEHQPMTVQGAESFDVKLSTRTDKQTTYYGGINPELTVVSFYALQPVTSPTPQLSPTVKETPATTAAPPASTKVVNASPTPKLMLPEETKVIPSPSADHPADITLLPVAAPTADPKASAPASDEKVEALSPTAVLVPQKSVPVVSTQVEEPSVVQSSAPKHPVSESRKSVLAQINQLQQTFKSRILTLLREAKTDGKSGPVLMLLLLAFGYGAVHAAGPGHGKGLTISYVIADGRQLKTALLLGIAIPVMHSLSGILVVFGVSALLQASALSALDSVTRPTQLVSYGLMILLGGGIVIKSLWAWQRKNETEEVPVTGGYGVWWAAVIAGMVPCPGVVFILLFAKSLGVMGLGVFMAVAMMLGMVVAMTGITLLVYGSRRCATTRLGGDSPWASRIEYSLELFGGLMIITFGFLFFLAALG